jgi:hypothetical protein
MYCPGHRRRAERAGLSGRRITVCVDRVVLVAQAIREQQVLLCAEGRGQVVQNPQDLFHALWIGIFHQVVCHGATGDEVARLLASNSGERFDNREVASRVELESAACRAASEVGVEQMC